jgi:hypothetical protein
MKMISMRLIPILTIALAAACTDAPKDPSSELTRGTGPVARARGEAAGLKIVLAVEGVDAEKRRITLRGPAGRVGTFPVAPEVRRLSEIHAGDTILAEYQVAATAELREPTAEEEKAPLVLAEMTDRRPSNLPPGATLARSVRVVTTIEAVNATAATVTLRGPLDGQVVTKVEDAAILPQLRVGQKIVVTFAETLILSVDPGTRKQ